MKAPSFSRAGSALLWQTAQHFGVKAIFLVRLLILARLLSPDDFGLLAISGVVIDVLMRITNFGMIPALVQRAEADEEHYDVAWTVGIVRALVVMSVTVLAAPIIAELFAEPRATAIIRVLALRPLIDASASIGVARLTRNLRFRSLALVELPKALANTVAAVAVARWLGVWALVVGALVGSAVYLVGSYIVAPHCPRVTFNQNAARSLIRFGQWVFFTSLIVMAGQSTLRLVIARQLGAAELGLYYLAASLAFLPFDVASEVVGQVAFPFYSRLQTDVQQVSLAFRAVLTSLSALLVPACALLIALAPSLVEHVLGSEWQGTVTLIRVLTLASIADLWGSAISPILQGMGRPDGILVIEAIQSSVLIVLAWLLADAYGVVGAAMAWLPATGMAQLVGIMLLRRILPRPFKDVGTPLGTIAIVSCIAAFAVAGVDHMIPGILGLFLASLTGVGLVAGLLWILERRFALGISDGLVKAFPRAAMFLGFPNG